MGRFVLFSLLLISSTGRGAFEHAPRGARAIALGGATVSLEGDPWASFANPSCLCNTPGTIVAAEYLPAMYGIPEINRGAVSLSSTMPIGAFALSVSGLGVELYHENCLGLSASHVLSDRVAVGLGVNLYSLEIRGYGGDLAAGLDIGAQVRIVPGLSYGVALQNLNRPSIGNGAEPLPQSLTMGISVHPLPGALVAVSVAKDSHYPFELSVGVEYSLEDLLTLRIGANHEPSTIAAGIGLRTSLLTLDYAFTLHPDLGGTHCISLFFALPWP